MPQKININDRFGHWTVIDIAPSKVSPCGTSRRAYRCQCGCGNIKDVAASELRNGRTLSCGCNGVYLKPQEVYQEWEVIKKVEETDKHGSQFYLCKCSNFSKVVLIHSKLASILVNLLSKSSSSNLSNLFSHSFNLQFRLLHVAHSQKTNTTKLTIVHGSVMQLQSCSILSFIRI